MPAVRARINQQRRFSRFWGVAGWVVSGLVIAMVAVIAVGFRVHFLPPSVERESAEYAAATTQVLVDFPGESALLSTRFPIEPLADRANVYARLAASPSIRELIGEEAGIDPALIDVSGPYNPEGERVLREPTAERRAIQLRAERMSYRLRFDTEPNEAVPIVLIYAQAPTVPAAESLADAGASGLSRFLMSIQEADGLEEAKRLRIEPIGEAVGGVVNPGVDRQIAALVFVATLLGWSVLAMIVSRIRRALRARDGVLPGPEASRNGQNGTQLRLEDSVTASDR